MAIQKIKLGDYCDIEKGKTGIKKAIPGDYPMVVTAKDRITHNEYDFDCKAVIIPLVSSTGHGHASINRLHHQEGKFALGTILAAVIVKDENVLDPRFLFIYLSYFKDKLLVPLMQGSANVSLNINKISNVEIILPTLEKQKEIINLEKENTKVLDLETEIQTQKDLVSKLKQFILQDAIEGKLTKEWRKENPDVEPASKLLERIKKGKEQLIKDKEIKKEQPLLPIVEKEIPFELPGSWKWSKLRDLCSKTGSGSTPKGGKSTYIESGIKFIRSQNVYNEELSIQDVAFISADVQKKMEGTIVGPEDLLLNITGGSIGRCCVVPKTFDTGNVNQHVAIIRLIEKELGYFLHKVILSSYFQKSIISAQTGAGREGLPKNKMDNLLIPVPSLKEQGVIVKKVESLMRKISILEEEIKESEENTQILMQAVLKEAFVNKT